MIPGWGHGLDSSPVGEEPRKSLQTWLAFPDVPRSEAQPVFSEASLGWGTGCMGQTSQCGPAGLGKDNREEKQRKLVVFLLGLWNQLESQLCVDLVGTCHKLKT